MVDRCFGPRASVAVTNVSEPPSAELMMTPWGGSRAIVTRKPRMASPPRGGVARGRSTGTSDVASASVSATADHCSSPVTVSAAIGTTSDARSPRCIPTSITSAVMNIAIAAKKNIRVMPLVNAAA